MKYFRIVTPTLLDIREIVTLGLTTKSDGTKIGSKGTGLKFILAYLHRLGGYLEAKAPTYHLRSEVVPISIRGHDHSLIQLRSQNADASVWETHMTLHAGSDTWTEPWFVLRELVQNALDEGGTYAIVDDGAVQDSAGTTVQVPLLPELEAAWADREIWMQPRSDGLVFRGHHAVKGIYYHGFLVYRATVPWEYSYDATSVLKHSEISEDRQVKNLDLSGVFHRVAERVDFDFDGGSLYQRALDLNPKEDVAKITDAVYNLVHHDKKAWGGAHGFKLAQLEETYHQRFGQMAAYMTQPVTEADPNVYYARASGYVPVTVPYRISSILSGYTEIKSVRECLPTLTNRLKKIKSVDPLRREKLKAALRLLRKIRPEGIAVDVVTKIVASDTINCQALSDPANNKILVLDTLLDQDIPEIAKVLIEEIVHFTSGGGDMSMEMQRALINVVYDLLTRSRKVSVANILT